MLCVCVLPAERPTSTTRGQPSGVEWLVGSSIAISTCEQQATGSEAGSMHRIASETDRSNLRPEAFPYDEYHRERDGG